MTKEIIQKKSAKIVAKRQNYFLEEQNKRLKSELAESKEYINVLINKLKLYQSKQ